MKSSEVNFTVIPNLTLITANICNMLMELSGNPHESFEFCISGPAEYAKLHGNKCFVHMSQPTLYI